MRIRSNKGFTLIELLIVVAIIGIIAAIAVPGLLRARMAGNEASAIGSLRAINSSQAAYSSSCAFGFYATTTVQLGATPVTGGAPFISPDLSAANPTQKSGYTVMLNAGSDGVANVATPVVTTTCNAVAVGSTISSYWANASPLSPGASGTRYFWTNTLGTIYTDPGAVIGLTLGNSVLGLQATALPLQ